MNVREGSQAARRSVGRFRKPNREGERMRKRSLWLVAAMLCAVGVLVGPALADTSLTPDHPVAAATGGGIESPTAWFVELKSPPSVKGTSASTLKAEHDAFKANAAAAGVKYTERYSFSTLR